VTSRSGRSELSGKRLDSRSLVTCTVIAGLLFCSISQAESTADSDPVPVENESRAGLGFRIRGGAVHSFNAGLESGGQFDSTRAVVETSIRYAFDEANFFGLSVGYNWDGYGFSPDAQIAGQAPWDQVQTLRLSTPLFWEFAERWRTLTIPILRLTAEEASDWNRGITGGAIVGFSYRFSERLRIGPGVGVLTELAGDPSIFPVILIDWQVTDRLRLETGRALGATEGPGLLASYEFLPWLKASLGFRYEKLRFRLESNEAARGTIGQDESFPVLAGLTLGYPFAELTLLVGSKFGGKLRIDDSAGNELAESSYDPAFTLGATFQVLF
jgi:hypothetical protein